MIINLDLNKPFIRINPHRSLLNSTISEYLSHVPQDERKELKEELTYNLKFKDEFETRLYELSMLFASLFTHNDELYNQLSRKFINREYTSNIHIIKMYNYYLNSEDLFEHIAEIYDLETSEHVANNIKSVMEKYRIKHELQIDLQHNKTKNNNLKI